MEKDELYRIAWKILEGHCIKDIEQHKIEQLATKIVDVLGMDRIMYQEYSNDGTAKPSSASNVRLRHDTPFMCKKMPEKELLKEVAIYLEGIYKGQGNIIPLGKIHLENLWTILHSLNA
jgi:hypothetical protein